MKSSSSLDTSAKIISAFILVIMVFIAYPLFTAGGSMGALLGSAIEIILLVTIVFCYLYAPQHYSLSGDVLIIHRIIKNKEIKLNGLKAIHYFPNIEKGLTLRTFGNGGLFGYFGYFTNKATGSFRMYSTKGKDFHILDFGKEKIGISPDSLDFIKHLKSSISP